MDKKCQSFYACIHFWKERKKIDIYPKISKINQYTIHYTNKLGFKMREKGKTLSSMHYLPQIHKNPLGACFIIASKL